MAEKVEEVVSGVCQLTSQTVLVNADCFSRAAPLFREDIERSEAFRISPVFVFILLLLEISENKRVHTVAGGYCAGTHIHHTVNLTGGITNHVSILCTFYVRTTGLSGNIAYDRKYRAWSRSWTVIVKRVVNFKLDKDSLPRWATLHPSNWTSVELTLWLEYVAKEYKMDVETTYNLVDSFQDLDGRRLLQMSQDDFRGINEQHGEFLYDIFRQMCIVAETNAVQYAYSSDEQFPGMGTVSLLPPIAERSRSATPSPTGSKGSHEEGNGIRDKEKDSSNK
ncbi:uncharacterized protein LOC125645486 [Ostrea edulis]|uniref:uncharacterized protein LOC125645486 n=1 Tax=Ostrea edulis TaxID=37623 RepID=UPI0024AEB340|nr:uncharacterized protein LOC125645486 [Ostrea edulis]